MSKVTIKDIAMELGSKPTEVLKKIKEIGINFKTQSSVTEEVAQIIYQYITEGIIPSDLSLFGIKENKKEVTSEIEEDKEVNIEKEAKKTKRARKDSTILGSEVKSELNKVVESGKKVESKKSRGIKIVSTGQDKVEETKKEIDIMLPKDAIKETEKIEKTEKVETIQKISVTENIETNQEFKKEPEKIEIIQKAEPVNSKIIKLENLEIKGFDATKKKLKISNIKVVSTNDRKQKKISVNANEILVRLKSEKVAEEKIEKTKKKKSITQRSSKSSGQFINIDRNLKDFNYEDDTDEIILNDLYERPLVNEEVERKEKTILNNRIKVNRYSPWMKEGSISRVGSRSKKRHYNSNVKNETKILKSITMPEEIRVYEFAELINLELSTVLSKLFMLGLKVLKNDFLDKDTIEILANEFDIEITIKNSQSEIIQEEIKEEDLESRAPVVTIMGHVDHGKTSLLDYIRNSRIAKSEAGGITQHIGAYMVNKNNKWISFIDTPGHEAFAQMRNRGAKVTDIAIIVIAADDGVKPQTKEALNYAKEAGVQIIIAMNKIDKEGINIDKVKSECAELGFTPIDWGGEYEFIPISAKSGEGIDLLLETILIQAEILDLKASKKATPQAVILEGSQQKGRGFVATIIVQQGILKIGQSILADTAYGKVRTINNDLGESLEFLEPSRVGQITGLSEIPLGGSLLQVVENDNIAKEIATKRLAYIRQKQFSKSTKISADELNDFIASQSNIITVVLRADTQGSLEAIRSSLETLNNEEVKINVIGYGIGLITQNDLSLANTGKNCIVIGFNSKPSNEIKALAKELNVPIKTYSIIYNLIDDMKKIVISYMAPIVEEEISGVAEVREIFNAAKIGTIAGCFVTDGSIERGFKAHVIRNNIRIWSGKLGSLKRFKDDVKEVSKGFECGITLDGFNELIIQDKIEVYKDVYKPRNL